MSRMRFGGKRCGGRALALFAALFVVLWSTAVAATVMLYADLARLVELSDVIVQGRVVDQNTFYDEAASEVATITTVQVERAFLGDVDTTVKFRQWGGAYGDKVSQIPGDAQFDPYEEVILFLADGRGKYAGMRYLTALGQSKYTVVRDGAEPFVVRDLHDLAFLDQGSNEIAHRPSERLMLDAFVPELESLIAAIKGGAR